MHRLDFNFTNNCRCAYYVESSPLFGSQEFRRERKRKWSRKEAIFFLPLSVFELHLVLGKRWKIEEKKRRRKLSVIMNSVTFPFFLCNQIDVLNSHFVYIFFSYSCRAHDLE